MSFFNSIKGFTNVLTGTPSIEANENNIDEIDFDQIATDDLINGLEEGCQYIEQFFGDIEKEVSKKVEEIAALNSKVTESDKEKDILKEKVNTSESRITKVNQEKDELSNYITDVCKTLNLKATKPKEQCTEIKSAFEKSKTQLDAFANITVFEKSHSGHNMTLKEVFEGRAVKSMKGAFPSLQESLRSSKLSASIILSEDKANLVKKEHKLNSFIHFMSGLQIFNKNIGPSLQQMFAQGLSPEKYSSVLETNLGIYGFKDKTEMKTIPVLIKNTKEFQDLSLSNFKTINNHILKLLENEDKDQIIKSKEEKISLMMAILSNESDQVYERDFQKEVAPSRIEELNLQSLENKTLLFLKVLLMHILHTTGIEFTNFEDIVQKFKKINAILHHERGLLINFAELMKTVINIDEKLDFEQELAHIVSNESGKNIIKKQLENIANSVYEKVFLYDEIIKNGSSSNGDAEYEEDESGEQSEEYYEDRHNDGSIKYNSYNASIKSSVLGNLPPIMNHKYRSNNLKAVRP